MSFLTLLYNLILGPLVLLFDAVYAMMYRMTSNEGLAIIALSLAINFLILPLYRRADAMQEEERLRLEKMKPGVDHIKKVFKGDERFMMLQTFYRQNNYKPYYALSGSVSLLLEIPFFIAAFRFLSGLDLLIGSSFGPISDLSHPDRLLSISGHTFNLLPILMTLINIISGVIYTRGMPLKSKMQLYGMALIFLFLLYSSPSGLVFYWTLNNLFSLVKNIFYKVKDPKLVLCILSAVFAGILLPYILIAHPIPSARISKFATFGTILMFLPLPSLLFFRKQKITFKTADASKADSIVFYVCCTLMAILTGLLIPSAVIAASPEEFFDLTQLHSPVGYVFNAFVTASGTFLVWMVIFYRLASSGVKRILSMVSVIIAGTAIINYMFFGKNYGNMSSMLQYDDLFTNNTTEYLNNFAVLIAAAAMLYIIWKKRHAAIRLISSVVCAALLIMSCMNVIAIQSVYKKFDSSTDYTSNSGIEWSLDKKGKNVVVIMMDRAISGFFPYLIEEKPILKKQFAGFTFYPNTISYGNTTMVGFPGIYGGYEYTPDEMNKRDDTSIRDKQDEALKVMPLLFSGAGYKTTVCDPPYAGMQWYPDLSIYDEYPQINKFVTKGVFAIGYDDDTANEILNRNFFAYSMFRISPVLLHQSIYNRGEYNRSSRSSAVQVVRDIYTASGGTDRKNTQFAKAYSVLEKLPDLTKVSDDGSNTFLLIDNDTTHDVMMLQEPEYEPSDFVDNRAYEEKIGARRAADGSELAFSSISQLIHYQCNMASMLRLGEWLDYLRENEMYDNTRIIIVSDHGRGLNSLMDLCFYDNNNSHSEPTNTLLYKSLLLVKDFGSSELTTDTTFMTNADTPLLALDGIIDNPVNPFTGKKLTSDIKNNSEHLIAFCGNDDAGEYRNDRKDYIIKQWVALKGNEVSDLSAWRIIDD